MASSLLSFSAGGIDVSQIVSGLMQAERAPLTVIQNRQAVVQRRLAALGAVRTDLDALRTHALALATGGMGKLVGSASSSAVAVAVGSAASAGSVTFTVDQVASTHGLRSGVVSSAASSITTAGLLAVSSTTTPLGIGGVRAGAGLGAGSQQVQVTRATTAAVRTATAPLAGATITAGANDTLSVEVDGVASTVTLAAGTYDAAGLAAAVDAAVGTAGLDAGVDVAGRLQLTTRHEGSAATLRVTGGTALGALGLGVDAAATTGTDGTISIGGVTTTVTSAAAGTTVTAGTGAGVLELTLSGGLRTGTAAVAVVSTGDRSLTAVADAVNRAGVGVTAATVKVADGQWLLQVTASRTGAASAVAIDGSGFAGGLVQTSAAADARITIGSGPGAYSITGAGNRFDGVLPGVTLTASAVSATPVTVSVTRDDAAVADGVVQLVGLANALLTQIAKHTKYDAATRTAGLLGGDPMVRRLATDVRSAITGVVAGSSLAVAANIGIVTKRDGTMEVDRQRLLDALAADPDAVRALFERGGAGTGSVTYAGSGDLSVAGTYDVVVTTAPTRATSGVVLVGGTPAGQQLGVRVGATTVTYDAAAGSTPAEIAAGLSAALASAGLAVTADVDGGGVRLRAAAYGTGGNFDYDVGAGWQSAAGTSVAGTIGGVAAIGIGDRLSLGDLVDSPARGVAVTVADGAAGAVGSVTVQPGIAARLSSLAARLTAPDGAFTSAKDGYDRRVQRFNEQIDRFEERMERIESNLVRQWSTIQRNLQSLQNQGNWLASQIGALAPAS